MSDTVNNGGPAFASGNPEQGGDPGMTLRDYFAGQALASIAEMHQGVPFDEKGAARSCYMFADAMLSYREKSK